MKNTSIFHIMKYPLTTFALILFLLTSCGAQGTTPAGPTAFQQDMENTTTVPNFTTAKSPLTREVLEPLGVPAGTLLVKRYATVNGGGSYDGSSWANAWAATNLRNNITNMTDADASKVYLIMIAGGTYMPTYDGNREISFSMKNYVAIMGGFKAGGGWERTGTTVFSGDIGTVNDNSDNSYNLFFHIHNPLNNSHLYGVNITKGNANGSDYHIFGGGMYNTSSSPNLTRVTFSGNTATRDGAGMYNFKSSPVLTSVLFSENTATDGAGMYNDSSSPMLTEVAFSKNTATRDGAGMYNASTSYPVLTSVVFSGNTATRNGAGMYNISSNPLIKNTVFSANSANSDGGGMYNSYSIPIIIGAVFTGNSAANGGGMANNNGGQAGGLFVVNTIFSDNKTNNGTGAGPDLAMNLSGNGPEEIRIAGSVLGIGLANPINAIVGYGGSETININYHHLKNSAVNLTGTATLTVNGMNFTYPTIQSGSSAIDLGLYARRVAGGNHYFSTDKETWYIGFSTTDGWGSAEALPDTTEDLTATDIAGKARTGRPDAGVNEF